MLNYTMLRCSFEIHYTTSQSFTMMRVLTGFMLITLLLMAILNGYVFVTMTTYRHMTRQRISMVLLLILVFIDLLCSLTFMPMYSVLSWMLSDGKISCPLHRVCHIVGYTVCVVTMLTILFINIQLYLAIVKPFIYQGHHNKRFYWLYLLATWLASVFMIIGWIYLYPERWGRFKNIIGVSIISIVFCVICILHAYVQSEVKKLLRKGSNNPTLVTSFNNHKTLRMTTFVVLTYGCCYFPFVLMNVYEFIYGHDIFVTLYIHPWVELVGISNGVWNPLIYCFRLSFIRRRGLMHIFNRARHRTINMTTVGVSQIERQRTFRNKACENS